jgi:signal peptidase I
MGRKHQTSKRHPATPSPDASPAAASAHVDRPSNEVDPTASATGLPTPPTTKPVAPWERETVESFAVALILAFLVRAFVAEAFIIPTGSMAPTLMGAHKDVACHECGFAYQTGASDEFDQLGQLKGEVVVQTVCPLCRHAQLLDMQARPNDVTFSGDRILVSKFSYALRSPRRWEVIVFKYPDDARINYIKRLVGRPEEDIAIRHGKILIAEKGEPQAEIARKPPHVIEALLQPVYDSQHLPKTAVAAGWPSPWQPLANAAGETLAGAEDWKVTQTSDRWRADFAPADENRQAWSWLRYYHRVLHPGQWQYLHQHGELPAPVDPYQSRLISDFTAYNAYTLVRRSLVYDGPRLRPQYAAALAELDLRIAGRGCHLARDGQHWVADLALEVELELADSQTAICLELTHSGVQYRCEIDVTAGQAQLAAVRSGEPLPAFEGPQGERVTHPTAAVSLRPGRRHRLKLANVDQQLVLWVDRRVIDFSPSGRYRSQEYLSQDQERPHWSPEDPLDAAPAGLAARGGAVQVHRARVWRDIYYIATSNVRQFNDYTAGDVEATVLRNIPRQQLIAGRQAFEEREFGPAAGRYAQADRSGAMARDLLFSTPQWWAEVPGLWDRNQVSFSMEQEQYFPLGDNSAASLDARLWRQEVYPPQSFVPRRLLIGRAVMVFWPHVWWRPIPFLPNFERMGLIR